MIEKTDSTELALPKKVTDAVVNAVLQEQRDIQILFRNAYEGIVEDVVRKGEEIFDPHDADGNPVNRMTIEPEDEWKLEYCYRETEDDIVTVRYDTGDDLVTHQYMGKQFLPCLLAEEGNRLVNVAVVFYANTKLNTQTITSIFERIRKNVQSITDVVILMEENFELLVNDHGVLTYESDGETQEIANVELASRLPPAGTSVQSISVVAGIPNEQY